jgi:hypothetical protein
MVYMGEGLKKRPGGVMEISANTDELKKLISKYEKINRSELPFAIAKSLTQQAVEIKEGETKALPEKLDRPTPFTMKAFGIQAATKVNLKARIFVKDIQARYLKYQISGGTRTPFSGKALTIPWRIKLNKYGNVPGMRGGKKIQELLAKPDTFSGTIRGISGIWKTSITGNATLLLAYEPSAKYRAKFPFLDIAGKLVQSNFIKKFRENFGAALRNTKG